MGDVPAPRGASTGPAPISSELPLEDTRRAFLAPKLAAVLAQFRPIEELERPDIEPAPHIPERWDNDERQ